MEDTHLDLVIRDVVQRVDDRFDRALHVGLHQDRPFDDVRCKVIEHRIEIGRCERGALFCRLFLTIGGDFTGALLVLDHGKLVARGRHTAKAQYLDRHGGPSFLDLLTLIIDDRTNTTALGADNKGVAALQRTARDEHGRNRATALVKLCLDHGRLSIAVRASLQFEQFGLKRDLLKQLIEPGLGLCRNLDILHIARHLLHDHFVFEQAIADVVRIGLWLVHLVDRNDHRDAGRLGVIDGLDRLRHDAVIGSDNQHDDIGHVRTARAHFCERGVARRIEEGDLLSLFLPGALRRDLVAADMLGDASGFALDHIRSAQRIEQ